ncbi:MAG TPA: hypothetical protein VFF14_01415 [Candidatus Deferrimicrobium sp.]|nr:hypothetical protein [Candidatus Deferrimicrobium sp.]
MKWRDQGRPAPIEGVRRELVIPCDECGQDLPLTVLSVNGNHYIGRFCQECGPYSRETEFYKTSDEAEKDLVLYTLGVG